MIEQTLQQAALALPAPELNYHSIEKDAKKRQAWQISTRPRSWVLVALCVLLLMGCAAGAVTYQLWNGGTGDWAFTEKTAAEMGFQLPEQLGDSPFLETWKYNLTDQDVSWLLALISPRYQYFGVRYGVETKTESTLPNGTPHTMHAVEKLVTLGFGSTDDPLWRRQFGFDENDEWTGDNNTIPTLKSQKTLGYGGHTLYVATYLYDEDPIPSQRVYWVDRTRGIVFRLIADGDTPDSVIEYAKQLIDLNP